MDQAAFDTETTLVGDGGFTPFGTDTRIAGFSISYDVEGREVDLYAPIRHVPYDWRRHPASMAKDVKHRGGEWLQRLLEVEGVAPMQGKDFTGMWLPGRDPNLDLEAVLALLQRMFNVPGIIWYAHNWPFDARVLVVDDIDVPWERMECTQALSVFTDARPLDKWDPTLKDGRGAYVHGGHGLKHLGEVYLGMPADAQTLLDEAKEALGPGSSKLWDYSMLPLRTALAPYACIDTRLTLRLAAHCKGREAYRDPRVRELLNAHRAERRLSVAMERRGMPVDQALCLERVKLKEAEVAALVAKANRLAGIVLNLGHGETLAAQLYDEL